MSFARRIAAGIVVAEQSWNAINVVAGEVAGIIGGATLHDYTTGEQWAQYVFPVSIPFGHQIYFGVHAENTGIADQIMSLTIRLKDPDGIVRAETVYTPALPPIAPGESFSKQTFSDRVTIDKAGIWILYVKLEAELA